jgi:sulfur relay (sulfurtransferase) complex TusBCD TusD component (DsrE family)
MEKFLFVISKGFEKSGAATRALQLASITAGKGLHVVVFFIDDAIHWAQLGMAEGIRSTTGEHMKDLLMSAATVLVGMMINPEYKVFTF